MGKKRHRVARLLSCCTSKQILSDEEEGFADIGPAKNEPAETEVIAAASVGLKSGSPHVSSGSLPEGTPVKVGNLATPGDTEFQFESKQKISIGNREKRFQGEIPILSSDEESTEGGGGGCQKVVHFAVCHNPVVKDSRDNYRKTPMKEKRCARSYDEEYFFLRNPDGDTIKVPLAELKKRVNEYVRVIVEAAYSAVISEDCDVRYDDVTETKDEKLSDQDNMSTDDGIDLSSAEEYDVISNMVDDLLCDLKTSLPILRNEEKSTESKPSITSQEENSTPSIDSSVSDVSTVTSEDVRQIESVTSLEWDGYAPLLREDPSYTDITVNALSLNCPDISAGNEP